MMIVKQNMEGRVVRSALVLVLLFCLLAGGLVRPARAATLVVTNNSDSGAGSLRQAITDASPGDTITFDASLSGQTFQLASTLLIDKDLAIDASTLENMVIIKGEERWDGLTLTGFTNLRINSGVSVSLENLMITDGAAPDTSGGGIYNSGDLTITNCDIYGNKSDWRASGIYNNGTLTLLDSVVRNNSLAYYGGGIFNQGVLYAENTSFLYNSGAYSDENTHGHPYGQGGGIYNLDGELTIVDCYFYSNNGSESYGGAIVNKSTTPAKITNSTFYKNESYYGSAISNHANAVLTVVNSTFVSNKTYLIEQGSGVGTIYNEGTLVSYHNTFSANSGGGGVYNVGNMSIFNTLIANSTSGADCYNYGTITDSAANLIEDGTCDAEYNGPPLIGELSDNGGPTETVALLRGSPAIDAADDTYCLAAPVNRLDQRGLYRPQGEGCDIGAFEAPAIKTLASLAAFDGGILEKTETANTGGFRSAMLNTFKLGDSNLDQQFRAILHFNTDAIPDGAVVTEAVLKIRAYAITGTNPFTTHGNIVVDIRKGSFYGNPVLQLIDFKAWANMTFAGVIRNEPENGWYSVTLKEEALKFIDTEGTTQFRLWFFKDDNDDMSEDYVRFFSGDQQGFYQPKLTVSYYEP